MQRLELKLKLKSLALAIIIYPAFISGQIHYNFENHDLSCWIMQVAGAWDTSSLFPISGNYSLRHIRDNTEAGSELICLPIDSLQPRQGLTNWQFALRHGYDPSSANRWAVFLVSDYTRDMGDDISTVEGIALTLNYETSDDGVKLIRKDNGKAYEIIHTGINWQEQVGTSEPVFFSVERTPSGDWTVSMEKKGFLPSVLFRGSSCESWLPDIQSFCIFYKYSAKQDQKLWFDDLSINGTFLKDTVPPSISGLKIISGNELVIRFSEPVRNDNISITILSTGKAPLVPDSISSYGDSSLYARFLSGFVSGSTSTITLENISDRKGNQSEMLEWDFFYRRAEKYDMLINEIMYDPEPANGLPEYEYIELFNRSEYDLCTAGWVLSKEGQSWVLGSWQVPSKGYMLLTCQEASALFGSQENIRGLFDSKTSLPNQGGPLILHDQYGRLISFVLYDPDWHTSGYKKNGGWSLERIDPGQSCGGADNWMSSISMIGGTPGFINSVRSDNPDRSTPRIINLFCPDRNSLQLEFNESMDPEWVQKTSLYSVSRGAGSPDSIIIERADFSVVRLVFADPFTKGLVYTLTIDEKLTDCCGNRLDHDGSEAFALAEPVAPRDVLFSEILFNPLPGGVDYLELFNNSNKVIDLNDLRLGTRDFESRQLELAGVVSKRHYLFYPGEYVALCSDPDVVRSMYYVRDPSCLVQTSLPALGDREGIAVLLDKWMEVIDELHYSEDMHFRLLDSREGISLERISFTGATNDPDSWHSSAETAGFGTPGYENSQFLSEINPDHRIHIYPVNFTPDNDGHEDVMSLAYAFEKPGNVLTVRVFDPRGRPVRSLATNKLAGTEGIITWDGLTDDHRMARSGMYLLIIEIFDGRGNTKIFKEMCILSRKYL